MNIKQRLQPSEIARIGSAPCYGDLMQLLASDALAEIERLEVISAAAYVMMTIKNNDPEVHLELLLSAGDALRKALGLPDAPEHPK